MTVLVTIRCPRGGVGSVPEFFPSCLLRACECVCARTCLHLGTYRPVPVKVTGQLPGFRSRFSPSITLSPEIKLGLGGKRFYLLSLLSSCSLTFKTGSLAAQASAEDYLKLPILPSSSQAPGLQVCAIPLGLCSARHGTGFTHARRALCH